MNKIPSGFDGLLDPGSGAFDPRDYRVLLARSMKLVLKNKHWDTPGPLKYRHSIQHPNIELMEMEFLQYTTAEICRKSAANEFVRSFIGYRKSGLYRDNCRFRIRKKRMNRAKREVLTLIRRSTRSREETRGIVTFVGGVRTSYLET